jgi:hypothetical protein
MSPVIVGIGMVSPAGLTPRANACVLWASALPPTASPFLREDGEAVPVTYCPWLGARLGMRERMTAMATAALDDALRPLRERSPSAVPPLLFCSPRGRPGLAPEDDVRLEQSLDLGLWEEDMRHELEDFTREAGACGARWRPGAWR